MLPFPWFISWLIQLSEFKLEPTMLMLCPLSKQTMGIYFQTSCIRVPFAFSWTFQERVLSELKAFCSATLTTPGATSHMHAQANIYTGDSFMEEISMCAQIRYMYTTLFFRIFPFPKR